MFRRSPNIEMNIMKGISSYLFKRYSEVQIISIGVNPDIYLNIIDVLLEIGYTISTGMQKKDDEDNKDSLEASDVSIMMEISSKFLQKPQYEVQNKEKFKENLIYLRLYKREFSSTIPKYQNVIRSPLKNKKKNKSNFRSYLKNRKTQNLYSLKYKSRKVENYKSESTFLPSIQSPKSTFKREENFSGRSVGSVSYKHSNNEMGLKQQNISNLDLNIIQSLKELKEIQRLNNKTELIMGSSPFSKK